MKFWKSFGASLLAVIVAMGTALCFVFVLGLVFILSFNIDMGEGVPKQSVLYINLTEDISDAPTASTFGTFDPTAMTFSEPITILEALTAIENAAVDGRIKGICININGTGCISDANIEELRGAIVRFKQSGKFVVAYDDTYTQSDYYLASAADKILLNPEGSLEWVGTSMQISFYKGLMDKLDVKAEVFRPTVCKYKSAVEPFIRTDMSPANREQMEALTSSVWNSLVEDVSNSRGISTEDLKRYAANLEVNLPEDALERGMIDMIAYEDELFELYDSYGVKRNEFGLHNRISLRDYVTDINISPKRVAVGNKKNVEEIEKPLVAIIYADGQIVDGTMYMDGYVFGGRLAEELRQARLDKNTKAVVVRVNSPGGSALASEVAWREMQLLQAKKPVVISMGSMAASGGYYISAPADYIFADKLTLTGSIGVYGMMFNFEDTLKNKLGITFDSASSSPNAKTISPFTSLTDAQRNSLLIGVDRVYTTFTTHVAEGRNLPIEHVLEIAEGRVWSGVDAVEIGLADEIGGFTEAVSKATQLAGITKSYTLYEFNAPLTPIEEWLESLESFDTVNMGAYYSIYSEEFKQLLLDNPMLITNNGIQTILPGDVSVEL
jgi:protease-4